jgi:hypothetical protein
MCRWDLPAPALPLEKPRRARYIFGKMVSAILRHVVGAEPEVERRAALKEALHRQIERALAEERWHFAAHFCDTLLTEDPRDEWAWLLKGDLAWYRFRDAKTAVDSYRRVLILGGFESSSASVAQARASLEQLLERLT